MDKYDFNLNLDDDNSTLYHINNMIASNTTILEFGPANGRLTKYLKNEKKCIVDIVEIDESSGENASQYSRTFYIGPECGDIEKYYWAKDKSVKYDYIIFADVLEHLISPEKVLMRAKDFLAQNGSILISIPNIAHNSILLELYNDNFEYNSTGILDNTHLRFFTKNSLKKMFDELDLIATNETAVYLPTNRTEFTSAYSDIPAAVAKNIRQRPLGNVYEFIFELKPTLKYYESPSPRYLNFDKYTGYEFVLYIQEDGDQGFSEYKTIKQLLLPDENAFKISLKQFSNVKKLRIDPISTNCFIILEHLSLSTNDKPIDFSMESHNALEILPKYYLFSHDDPCWIISSQISPEYLEISVLFMDYDSISLPHYSSLFSKISLESQTKQIELELQIIELKNQSEKQENIQIDYKTQIDEIVLNRDNLDYEIKQLRAENKKLQVENIRISSANKETMDLLRNKEQEILKLFSKDD